MTMFQAFRASILCFVLLSLGLSLGCAHKRKEVKFTAKASEKKAIGAAICALHAEGYDADVEIDRELGWVSGRRYADVGGFLDAESIVATIEVVPTSRRKNDVYLTYRPGSAVITSGAEMRSKMEDLEDSFHSCLGRRR